MFRKWSSAYHLTWTPILSFERRRSAWLDWVEAHLEPVAFAEASDQVGIALVSSDMRLTINRDGFSVDTGLSDLPIAVLLPAIEGMFEVMEPKATRLTHHSASSTVELPGAHLKDECEKFALRAGAPRSVAGGLKSFDGSVLFDMQSDVRHVQVEYGIVGRRELADRLSAPSIGRLVSSRSRRERREQAFWDEEAADVSMFIGTDAHPKVKTEMSVASSTDLVLVTEDLDSMVENISNSLHEQHVAKQRGVA